MKTRFKFFGQSPKSILMPFLLLFLFLFYNNTIVAGNTQDTIQVKLIGGGTGSYTYYYDDGTGEYQRNDYSLELNFDLAVTPLYETSDQQVVCRIADFTGSAHLLSKVEDNRKTTSYGYDISQDFNTKSTDVGRLNYSIKDNSLKYIEFIFPSKNSSESYLKKIIFENNTVKAYYYLSPIGICLIEVPATASLDGIFLEIIETAKTENVKYVGYIEGKSKKQFSFPVFKTPKGRYALIDKFKETISGITTFYDFKNEILLLDKDKKQIGHMYYEYKYVLNKDQVRNAILILHNDEKICNRGDGKYFPYGLDTDTKDYNKDWDYYETGEYPVSMLIPPLNKFPEKYDKSPILLLHGLSGKYEYSKWKYFNKLGISFGAQELSNPKSEDISYWYTTPRILNKEFPSFHTWQMYYPNNDGAITVAECLKFDLEHLKILYSQKINLVTHSYGGIITRQYLSSYPDYAKNNLKKVLFMAPPFHGSFSANRAYEDITGTGTFAQIFDGMDKEAHCYRDASLGSEIIRNYWNKPLPSLNGGQYYEDYFVIAGTTSKNYITENIHEEAKDHSDGLVAISSASLLDQNIGFATIPGNHDDAIHAQSNHPGQENIKDSKLIPNLIHDYFKNEKNEDFLNILKIDPEKKYDKVMAIVNYDKTVLKPEEISSLSNLETTTKENYQMSLLNFEVINSQFNGFFSPFELWAYLHDNNSTLQLKYNLIELENYKCIGKFRKNMYTGIYYFQKNGEEWNSTYKIDDGCAIDLEEGKMKLILNSNTNLFKMIENIEIGYSQSHFVSFDLEDKKFFWENSNGNTAIKSEFLSPSSKKSGSTGKAEISVDNQSSQAIFLLSLQQALIKSFSANLLQPDGEIYNKTSWQKDTVSGLYSIKVDNPMAGVWQICPKDTTLVIDTLFYEVQGLFQSKLILYDANEKQIDIKDSYKSTSIFVLPDKNKLSDIKMKATITSPLDKKSEIDFGLSKVPTDSGFVFSFPLNQDITGIYSVSVECSGTYNGNKFERFYSSQIKVVDNTPHLVIPDIYLDGLSPYKEINLKEQIYCLSCNNEDFVFSSNLLGNKDISVSINSTSMANVSSSFKDTTTAIVEFVAKSGNQVICRDTVLVHKSLPDLKILNFQISDTTFVAGKTISISFDIFNDGNSYTNNYGKIGLVLSKNGNFDNTDMLLSNIDFQILSPHDTIHFTKDIIIPGGISVKYPFLLVAADIDSLIYESNKTNNVYKEEINFSAQTNYKQMVTVNKDNGELVLTNPNPLSPVAISYNGYDVISVPWWNNYFIWAYASGNELPVWVNYEFNIDNYESLDSVKVLFRARGTTSDGIYYSYLFQQINNIIVSNYKQQLINSNDWTTYTLILPKGYFNKGLNQVKIGTSIGSQTYVAINGVAIEFYYKQDPVVVNIDPFILMDDQNYLIYPNPANNILIVKNLTENAKVALYDLNGKLIQFTSISNDQLDISRIQPGMYLIKIETSQSRVIRKFVKQ